MNKETYPILPLRDIVVYPKMIVPLFVGREKSIKALQQAIDNDQNIVLATQKEAAVEDPKPEDIFKVGTLGTVVQLVRLPDGTVKVLVEGLERVKIDDFIMADGFMQVDVEILAEDNVHDVETEALSRCFPSLKNMSSFPKKCRRKFWFRSARLRTTTNWRTPLLRICR